MNWSLPTLTDLYTDVLTFLKGRDTDLAKGLDPAVVTVTNPEANFIRWNSANGYWEKFNGTVWSALASAYVIQVGAFTGDVTKPSGSSVLTIGAAKVVNTMLRNSSALSVIGRAANSVGDPADIVATVDDRLLTRVAGALAWSQLTVGMFPSALDNPAQLDIEDQALTGGVIVTSKSLGTVSTGTVTPDPGDRPQQHYTNGGAHALAPSTNVGSILVDITNNATAGAITTSGFTFVAGDAFTTTNGHKFRCHISVGSAGSLLSVQALQ